MPHTYIIFAGTTGSGLTACDIAAKSTWVRAASHKHMVVPMFSPTTRLHAQYLTRINQHADGKQPLVCDSGIQIWDIRLVMVYGCSGLASRSPGHIGDKGARASLSRSTTSPKKQRDQSNSSKERIRASMGHTVHHQTGSILYLVCPRDLIDQA